MAQLSVTELSVGHLTKIRVKVSDSGKVRLGQPAGLWARNVTCGRDRKFNFVQPHTIDSATILFFQHIFPYNFGSSLQKQACYILLKTT